MARTPRDPKAKLDALLEQRAKIDAQLIAARRKMQAQARKDDTRRKIIAGGLALKHAEISPEFGNAFWRLIREHVTRADERALFGLDPLPETEGDASSPSETWHQAVSAAE